MSRALSFLACGAATLWRMVSAARLPLYVGTYTDGESRGIYLVEFDTVAERFSAPRLLAEAVNPSFFARHPALPVLYAVCETDTIGPERAGGLLSYRIGDDGALKAMDVVGTGGAGACHVSIAADGARAWVANYHAGSLAAFDLDAVGRISSRLGVIEHVGRGPHPTRQRRPHVHAMEPSPGGRFVIAIDLGTDAIVSYRTDGGRVVTPPASVTQARPGAGPRHLAFHPDGRTVVVINELDSTVVAYVWDEETGALAWRSEQSTLPGGWRGENTTAEVAIHPSGAFVYGSNRGHDSIAAFGIDAGTALVPIRIHPTGGRTPRHFSIDAAGTFLFAANQESDSISAFRIDPRNGVLTDTGARASVPSPVYVGATG